MALAKRPRYAKVAATRLAVGHAKSDRIILSVGFHQAQPNIIDIGQEIA
ncbi:hypothetical protein BJP36_41460 [Moorena producens JHB]|uniref:Uncharacterized protein n=1 Tax=Moorena producens (strain JHB) TaxID=1454205 RepID=A0A9Q9SSJ7_MOOP1|nr:hypothetical protein [Moorena producens]WAN68833.1 hypothetical protein BJP36_41460 [Moorena producens JHB]